jgi:hypothetical protein
MRGNFWSCGCKTECEGLEGWSIHVRLHSFSEAFCPECGAARPSCQAVDITSDLPETIFEGIPVHVVEGIDAR